MHRKLLIFWIIVITLPLTSCIDIVEEIWIKEDKSGKMEFRIDAGNLGFLFGQIADYLDKDLSKQLSTAPDKYGKKLKGIKGVSQVKSVSNFKEGKLGLGFEFKNQKALNEAWYALLGVEKKFFYPKVYKINKRRFKKRNLYKYLFKYLKQNKEKVKSEKVFQLVHVKSIYHVPDTIKKLKNEDHTKKVGDKMLFQDYTLETLLSEELDLGQRVRY